MPGNNSGAVIMPNRDREQPARATATMRVLRSVNLLILGLTTTVAAGAQQIAPDGGQHLPFTAQFSNLVPLAFGMDVGETSHALQQPLQYVSGAPGDEVYLALRDLGGSGLIAHHNRLFLKFRRGRLTGWKEDYGSNWMWR